MFLSFAGLLTKPSFLAPSTITKASALGRCQRRRESTDEKRKRQPDRQLHRGLAGFIEIGLDLHDHLVVPLVRVGLAEAGSRSDHLRDIAAIGCRWFGAIAEVGGKQTNEFTARFADIGGVFC